jgi:hypothetical protein
MDKVFWWESQAERDHWEDINIVRRAILQEVMGRNVHLLFLSLHF